VDVRKVKRDPITSIAAQAGLMAEAASAAGEEESPIRPPAHMKMEPRDEPFWAAIVESRAADEWSTNDLTIAAQLARVQAEMESESARLRQEGTVRRRRGRGMIANPRIKVLDMLARRELALMRALKLSGVVLGDPRREAARRAMERDAKNAAKKAHDEDPLLAGGSGTATRQ